MTNEADSRAEIGRGSVFMAAQPQTIDSLRTRQEEARASHQELIDAADTDNRDLTGEELAQSDEFVTQMEHLGRQIQAREAMQVSAHGTGRRTVSDAAAMQVQNAGQRPATVPAQVKRNDPRMGFANFGDFALGVRAIAVQQHDNEYARRILNAVTTYGNEGVGTDGGFLVPPEFSTQIWEKVTAEDSLMARCMQLRTGGNSLAIPKNETTPWGTTGIRVYWEGEAASLVPAKPSFGADQFRLTKLTALVPVTDENLEDAPGLESWLRAYTPGAMTQAINTAIVSGTGVGMPKGLLNHASLVSVAKETSQPADTIYFANLNKMYSRMYGPWRRNAVWLINQDLEPQLHAMAFDPAASSKYPVYMPAGGLSGAPYGTLFGRDVITLEACSAIGDQGDIFFVDLNQYWILQKSGGGQRVDTSIHLYFDQSVTTFRFVFRLNGQGAWQTTIARQNGANTLSWAVTLDPR